MAKKINSNDKGVTLTLEYQKPKLFWKIFLAFLTISFFSLVISGFFFYRKASHYLENFLTAAQITRDDLEKTVQEISESWRYYYQNPDQAIQKQTLLILGGDQLSDRKGDPVLTDTILLVQFDTLNAVLSTISLPRDLYNQNYQTKINALYHYGVERNPNNPLEFSTQAIEEMTGTNIDHSLLINIEDLEFLIDLLGGVEIDVPVAFTDPLFPRQGIDVSVENDPKILYETISFTEGKELMNGLRALQYMRSRHSNDDEGTDLARSSRQQLVLTALTQKLSHPQLFFNNPETLGKLYRFYLDQFADNLSINELSKIFFSFLILANEKKSDFPKIKLENFPMTIYPADENGLLFNPPLWQTQQQWLYQIRDQEQFKNTIQDFFNKLD